MHSKIKGNIGLLKTILYLLEKGYIPNIPFGDNDRYDVVAEKDGKFTRIQVKYVSMKDGIIVVPFKSMTRKAGKNIMLPYTSKQVDEIWAYCPNTEKLYAISVKSFEGQLQVYLRVDSPKKKVGKINYAKDFTLQ
jgi:hypothetical protein